MPLIHFVMIFLMFAQWLDYLYMFDFINKYISLLTRALSDIFGFMILFFWLLLFFSLSFSVMGATFDDGDNFDGAYDTKHNDYPQLGMVYVYLLQNLRTAIGDLQSPSYDYWGNIYNEGDEDFAFFHIAIIWLIWFLQIIIVVICMLNFLIAIVSDSYNYIVEREKLKSI